ncbi:hypothetical protein RDI58_020383 [Solanum bulbocastanum]|uniref:RNase H type-1 domain-containing protein n=1 Tax=Solanum bulbocastanum TaxID=147425 RepID=A0AAN8TCR6_SOLBU
MWSTVRFFAFEYIFRPPRTSWTIEEYYKIIILKTKVKWKPRVPGRFKLNTDGAVKENPGPGGLGGVIRNHRGDWIIGCYQQRSPCQPNPGKVINGEAGSSDARKVSSTVLSEIQH